MLWEVERWRPSLCKLEKKNFSYVLVTEFIYDDTRSTHLFSCVPAIYRRCSK
jgi:hypothetical protein